VIDRDAVERQIAKTERMENPVSFVCGAALAGAYFLWQLSNHWIATYTWIIPFAIGFAAPRLWFAARVSKLDRMLRADEQLPEARVVALPPAVVPVASAAPEPIAPASDGAGPSVLK
jgi:hypothetical protein